MKVIATPDDLNLDLTPLTDLFSGDAPIGRPAPALRSKVQMVFQNPATSFNPAMTIEQALVGDDGWANGVHSTIVAHYINAFGSEEQKQRWLPGMASGELVGAIAMTESSPRKLARCCM